ncbi:MAG TPA: glucoamylase family protein, partial [Kiritimatiellia bacterium]
RRSNGAGYRNRSKRLSVKAQAVPEAFQTMREGQIVYHFDVAPGMYRVSLSFLEPEVLTGSPRTFNVLFNDHLILQEFDPGMEFGAGRPIQQTFHFRVAQRGLQIRAVSLVGEPILSLIYVEKVAVDDSVPEPPVVNQVIARDGVVHVAWSPLPGQHPAKYEVWRSDSRSSPFTHVATLPSGTTSFVDRLVRNGRVYTYEVVALDARGRHRGGSARAAARPHVPTDDELLDMTQRAAFRFFLRECDPSTFLTRDKNVAGYVSTAAVGFGLSAYCIGAERCWITRDDAEHRCFTMLKTLNGRDDNKRDGMFFHYLNGDGSRSKEGFEDAASTIESALLAWGAIAAGEYFGGRVKEQADKLVGAMNWRAWANEERKQIRMAWKPHPEKGDAAGEYVWQWDWFTDETLLINLLAIGAPNPAHRVPVDYFFSWRRPLGLYGDNRDVIYSHPGTLFTYTFAHCWLDFQRLGADDPAAHGFKDQPALAPWTNTIKAIRANRQYCIDQARRFKTFGPDSWGLTACSGKDAYCVAGAPPCQDPPNPGGGTVALFAAGMSVPFVPDEAMSALRHYYRHHDAAGYRRLWKDEFEGGYGFIDSYSLDQDFYSPEIHGINHGPMLCLIENHRSGLLWKYVLKNEMVRSALRSVGFTAPA